MSPFFWTRLGGWKSIAADYICIKCKEPVILYSAVKIVRCWFDINPTLQLQCFLHSAKIHQVVIICPREIFFDSKIAGNSFLYVGKKPVTMHRTWGFTDEREDRVRVVMQFWARHELEFLSTFCNIFTWQCQGQKLIKASKNVLMENKFKKSMVDAKL